jgi:ribonuclease-3
MIFLIDKALSLEKYIRYTFHDKNILEKALTRRAFLNDNHISFEECMNPLATVGDAVLDTVALYRLYENKKLNQGELTKRKIVQVKRKRTKAFAERHQLNNYVKWGKGEQVQKNWEQEKPMDTITEALIGAVFLDAQQNCMNGINVVTDILERLKFFDSETEEL